MLDFIIAKILVQVANNFLKTAVIDEYFIVMSFAWV